MLTSKELADGEVNATDDMDGVDRLIKNLHNTVMKKHMKVYELFQDKKPEEALLLRETITELEKEIDGMIKRQMNFQKYLKATGQNQGRPQEKTGVSAEIKSQRSSNGAIVAEIPKH